MISRTEQVQRNKEEAIANVLRLEKENLAGSVALKSMAILAWGEIAPGALCSPAVFFETRLWWVTGVGIGAALSGLRDLRKRASRIQEIGDITAGTIRKIEKQAQLLKGDGI